MKKIVLSLMLIMMLFANIVLKAQSKDSFFDYEVANEKVYKYDNSVGTDNTTNFNRAPLGNGLLLLGGMALTYAFMTKKK